MNEDPGSFLNREDERVLIKDRQRERNGAMKSVRRPRAESDLGARTQRGVEPEGLVGRPKVEHLAEREHTADDRRGHAERLE